MAPRRSAVSVSVSLTVFCCFAALYIIWPSKSGETPSSLDFLDQSSSAYWKTARLTGPTSWPSRYFVSSPARPPDLAVSRHGGPLAEGSIFISPGTRSRDGSLRSEGFIFTDGGELIYAGGLDGEENVADFRVQTYRGRRYLTFWRGRTLGGANSMGHGYGEVVFIDDQYDTFTVVPHELKKTITVGTGEARGKSGDIDFGADRLDFHEVEVTERNTLLVAAYNHTRYDLTAMGGSTKGWVLDSMFFEIHIETGEILFSWSALDHVDARKSHMPLVSSSGDGSEGAPYDFFHISSVQAVDREHFLVNSRHMWATYLVKRSDGNVLWKIDGATGGDFGRLPDDGSFRWTHHARAHNVTAESMIISWFDNHYYGGGQAVVPSRGLMMKLALPPSRGIRPELIMNTDAKMKKRVFTRNHGSYQADLEFGNQLICYGEQPLLFELSPTGEVLWSARFGNTSTSQSYRASKQVWRATPRSWNPRLVIRPDLAREQRGDGKIPVRGYVSWNGATEVEKWLLYVGADGEKVRPAGSTPRRGFETVFLLEIDEDECVEAAAFQHGGEERRSNVACL